MGPVNHFAERGMGTLILTRIFPNPPGRDSSWGTTTNEKLNGEWAEFAAAGGSRNLTSDVLYHRTHYSGTCTVSGIADLITFASSTLPEGHSVRVHTGSGTAWQEGTVHHIYLGRSWFVWNNACGDEASIGYNGSIIDRASYAPNPPERVLTRVPGTNRFA